MKTIDGEIVIESGDVVSVSCIPFEAKEVFEGMEFDTIQVANVITINGEEFQMSQNRERIRRIGPIIQVGEQEEWRIAPLSIEMPE